MCLSLSLSLSLSIYIYIHKCSTGQTRDAHTRRCDEAGLGPPKPELSRFPVDSRAERHAATTVSFSENMPRP